MNEKPINGLQRDVHWLPAIILTGMAGGIGWGIRGQYGHESGAMIAGVLVGSVVALLFARHFGCLRAARVAAFFALGVSVGGSMTYGQTLGLTHDAPLVGNWEALRWGYLGTLIKGGIWIGWGATLVAMQLSRMRYGPLELACLFLALIFLWFAGIYFLNEPFDPASRTLPKIYFSDDWYWEPDGDLTPRRESWGGLLVALIALLAYTRVVRHDWLTLRLGLWGFVAGGLGFANGQMLQAAQHWNPQWMAKLLPWDGWRQGVESYQPYINWWNMMEISFGTIFGALLGFGIWLNRHGIDPASEGGSPEYRDADATSRELPDGSEWMLMAIHVVALMTVNFIDFAPFDRFTDQAITMIAIPAIAVAIGYRWPFFLLLPITLLPIAGKTVRHLAYEELAIQPVPAWIVYFALPVALLLAVAVTLVRRRQRIRVKSFAGWTLGITVWTYFFLNFAFFRYPWPWTEWTGRTPSAIIMFVDLVGLTIGAVYYARKS